MTHEITQASSPHLTSPHLTSPHPTPPLLTSPHLSSPHLTSPHLTSPHLTSPHLTSPHLTSPHLTSPHLTSPHLTSPHLTSPHLTSPHPTSPHLTSPHLTPPHPTPPHPTSHHHTSEGHVWKMLARSVPPLIPKSSLCCKTTHRIARSLCSFSTKGASFMAPISFCIVGSGIMCHDNQATLGLLHRDYPPPPLRACVCSYFFVCLYLVRVLIWKTSPCSAPSPLCFPKYGRVKCS